MLYALLNKMADAPRQSLFLVTGAAVVGALLSSMYLVCDAQVRSAQTHHASVKAQRLALYDCLHNDPRTSYAACVSQVAQTFQTPSQSRNANSAVALRAVHGGGERSQVSAMMPVAYYSR